MLRGEFKYEQVFPLELGSELPHLTIAYHTFGQLNKDRSNVVWICHALTANSDPSDWWKGLVGKDSLINPKDHYIVCANIIGSCYGSTGPLSIDPGNGKPYYHRFPKITIRDMVNAHQLLRQHLGIGKIHLAIGGSMGGYQVLEWSLIAPGVIDNMVLLATGAKESAWGKGIHYTQRQAIINDFSWKQENEDAGRNGLRLARAIGMLTYRNYEAFVETQTDEIPVTDDFKVVSYLNYQGKKLADRFNAFSYIALSYAMDAHHVARKRGGLEHALNSIDSSCLVIGISSDILCPPLEQKFLARHIPDAGYVEIDSLFGHDGFLVETEKISQAISRYFGDNI